MRSSWWSFLGPSTVGLLVGACHSEAPARAPAPAPAPVAPQPWIAPPPSAPPPSACTPEGSYACTPDRGAMLQCRRGVFTVVSTCRGARACSDGALIACDASISMPNDPCDVPNRSACGTDRRTLLRCTNGVFQPAETCRNACLSTADRVLCQ